MARMSVCVCVCVCAGYNCKKKQSVNVLLDRSQVWAGWDKNLNYSTIINWSM